MGLPGHWILEGNLIVSLDAFKVEGPSETAEALLDPSEIEEVKMKLIRYGSPFDLECDRYLPLKEPIRTKAGKIAKRQPEIRVMSRSYWQAQCSFRGLPTSGSVEELQRRIHARDRAHDVQVQREQNGLWRTIHHLEEQERREEEQHRKVLEERNRVVFEQNWLGWDVHTKAKADPSRLLRETFNLGPKPANLRSSQLSPLNTFSHPISESNPLPSISTFFNSGSNTVTSSSNTALVIKTKDRARIRQLCRSMGLEHQSTNAPHGPKNGFPDRWIIVGNDQKAISKAMNEVRSEVAQAFAEQSTSRTNDTAANHAKVSKDVAGPHRSSWNICGTYSINCPELSEYSRGPDYPDKLTMTIYRDMARTTGEHTSDQDSDYDGYDADEGRDKGQDEVEYDVLGLLATDRRYFASFEFAMVEGIMRINCPEPAKTSRNTSGKYIWRGKENGMGEIQLNSDAVVQDISFGDNGTTISGTFKCEYISGFLSFTGIKVAQSRGSGVSSSEEAWNDLDEAAYERAYVGRWGGWYQR